MLSNIKRELSSMADDGATAVMKAVTLYLCIPALAVLMFSLVFIGFLTFVSVSNAVVSWVASLRENLKDRRNPNWPQIRCLKNAILQLEDLSVRTPEVEDKIRECRGKLHELRLSEQERAAATRAEKAADQAHRAVGGANRALRDPDTAGLPRAVAGDYQADAPQRQDLPRAVVDNHRGDRQETAP